MANATKRALAQSLKKLLADRPLDKITVGDVTGDCGVNRQTFYYHFHDIFALIEWIFEEEIETPSPSELTKESWRRILGDTFQYLIDNSSLALNAYHSTGWEYLRDYLCRRLRPYLEAVAAREADGLDVAADDLSFVVDLYQSAAVGIFEAWLSRSMNTGYEDDLDRLFLTTESSMSHTIAQFDGRGRKKGVE